MRMDGTPTHGRNFVISNPRQIAQIKRTDKSQTPELIKITEAIEAVEAAEKTEKNVTSEISENLQDELTEENILDELLNNSSFSDFIKADRAIFEARRAEKAEKREQARLDKLEHMNNGYEMIASEMENIRKQGEEQAKAARIRVKCMQIAMYIMMGEKVSPEDHKFLLEHDPALYGKAVMMRVQKENQKEIKKISDDEDSLSPSNPAEQMRELSENYGSVADNTAAASESESSE